jgi:hypothetical protein
MTNIQPPVIVIECGPKCLAKYTEAFSESQERVKRWCPYLKIAPHFYRDCDDPEER